MDMDTYTFTERNFGYKAEILHSMKADVAQRLIRRCIETIEKFAKLMGKRKYIFLKFLVSMQRLIILCCLLSQNAKSLFYPRNFSLFELFDLPRAALR